MGELIAAQEEVDRLEAEEFAHIEPEVEEDEGEYKSMFNHPIVSLVWWMLNPNYAVPEEVEHVARRTFAIVDELQQVRFAPSPRH